MINQLIHKVIRANSEMAQALEQLAQIFGVDGISETVFEGQHLRLFTVPTNSVPKKKKRKGGGSMSLSRRAEGASINVAADPKTWPFEQERHPKREPAFTIQKELKEYLKTAGKKGLERQQIFLHIGQFLPPKYKRNANKSGLKVWKSSLGNLLRNYSAAGYMNCERGETKSKDVFTIGE
jgi:hypothetical protein